ncbi:MAG TPA: HAMP domain-containing sensor histidine kinase, partial [Solirubrobacteraceae bacterium]|nr:HAMP domain-containing sensor histidine kinase [Solirubrobacteraceae bacterium]
MTLRARIAAGASVAVALAVLAAAVGVYIAVRADLRSEVDRSLSQRGQALTARAAFAATLEPPVPGAGSPPPAPLGGRGPLERGLAGGGFPREVQPARFGAASGYVQFISPQGALSVPGGQGSTPQIAPAAADRKIAAAGRGRAFSDRTVRGTHLRVLTLGSGALGAVQIVRPLSEVDSALRRILLILALVGAGGIALAALLGGLVARAALTPIVRFTARTEALTGALDTSQRVEVRGRDELARLASSFNATLDALERSVAAQRQLVADASHELRTPIASLRANIQVLADAERLPAADQASLRRDIIEELDELTSLVSDVVELARGSGPVAVHDEVRLDEIVTGVVERARRRGHVSFELALEPAVVHGDPGRIDRAVSNLLDNARKWSPSGAEVNVELRAGTLCVRDHGPGFAAQDLPKVFERFYR